MGTVILLKLCKAGAVMAIGYAFLGFFSIVGADLWVTFMPAMFPGLVESGTVAATIESSVLLDAMFFLSILCLGMLAIPTAVATFISVLLTDF